MPFRPPRDAHHLDYAWLEVDLGADPHPFPPARVSALQASASSGRETTVRGSCPSIGVAVCLLNLGQCGERNVTLGNWRIAMNWEISDGADCPGAINACKSKPELALRYGVKCFGG